MNKYLVTIHHPHGYNPEQAEDAAMGRAIDELNDEMVAAGIRLFVGGLYPPDRARTLRPDPAGDVKVTEGLCLKTQDYVGGLWVLAAASLDEALEWGRKAAIACRAPVEVRPFH